MSANGNGNGNGNHRDAVPVPVLSAVPERDVVSELTQQAVSLSRSLHGPLKRIALSRGEVTVEVDWQEAAPPAAPAVHPVGVPGVVVLPDTEAAEQAGEALHTVRGPLVGTFYLATSPGQA